MIRHLNNGEIGILKKRYYKLLRAKKVLLSKERIRRFFKGTSSNRELLSVYSLLAVSDCDLIHSYIEDLGGELPKLNQYMLSELHRRGLINDETLHNIKKLTVDYRYYGSNASDESLDDIYNEKSEKLEEEENIDLWDQYYLGIKIFLDMLDERNIFHQEMDTLEAALWGDCTGYENFRKLYEVVDLNREEFLEYEDPGEALMHYFNEGATTHFIDLKINKLFLLRADNKLSNLESNGIMNELFCIDGYTYLTIADSAQLGVLDTEVLLHLIVMILEVDVDVI